MAAFVLGNGVSRRPISIDHLLTLGDVYACNAVYRTHRVTALVATDRDIAQAIQDSGYSRENRFYTRKPLPGSGAQRVPQDYFGYSSGPIATAIACLDHHPRIYLLGFDMGPDEQGRFNNLYADTDFYKKTGSAPTFSGNWARQIAKICQEFAGVEFFRVCGQTTAEVPQIASLSNLQALSMTDFVDRINSTKDL